MVNTIKRRGLSDVVTTVLIILLVLAAVAIIWGYLRGTLQQGGQQVTSACITLDLKPTSCNVSLASQIAGASVKYERNSGAASVTNVSVVWTFADGTTRTNTTGAISALESKVFSSALGTAATDPRPVSVAVAGTVVTENGATKLCDRSQTVQCS